MHGAVSKHGMHHALGDCYCDDWAVEDAGMGRKQPSANNGYILLKLRILSGLPARCWPRRVS